MYSFSFSCSFSFSQFKSGRRGCAVVPACNSMLVCLFFFLFLWLGNKLVSWPGCSTAKETGSSTPSWPRLQEQQQWNRLMGRLKRSLDQLDKTRPLHDVYSFCLFYFFLAVGPTLCCKSFEIKYGMGAEWLLSLAGYCKKCTYRKTWPNIKIAVEVGKYSPKVNIGIVCCCCFFFRKTTWFCERVVFFFTIARQQKSQGNENGLIIFQVWSL